MNIDNKWKEKLQKNTDSNGWNLKIINFMGNFIETCTYW